MRDLHEAASSLAPAESFALLDRSLHALQGRFSLGVSPLGPPLAWLNWSAHALNCPYRWMDFALDAAERWVALAGVPGGVKAIEPAPEDHRFTYPGWTQLPFSLFAQSFLLGESWWGRVVADIPGAGASSTRVVGFATRQMLDMFSPSNVPALNPEVIATTFTEGGGNLLRGGQQLLADLCRALGGRAQEISGLKVGEDLAASPGEVVLRNDLLELIQYAPTTPTVRPEPVLLVPAWIMKYYILDLSAQNSLVSYLTDQGFTVFAISWRNPTSALGDTSLDDYRSEGVMKAIDAIEKICRAGEAPFRIHACGYCLGGTLLSIAAAAMARDGDARLATVSLLCAQMDFTEAGELQVFITEDQIAFLEDVMRAQGYLDSQQMAGAFQMLRPNDLIWSRAIRSYLLGEAQHPNDLMAWNADGTRMPARMHAEYLRSLFLDNDLAEGRLQAGSRPVSLGDIGEPLFVVSTETDHIAPWRSVYKIHLLVPGEITFVLTSGGHNAGVVNPPAHSHRHYRIARRAPGDRYRGPRDWRQAAPCHAGSWWPAWLAWLASHSGAPVPPPPQGASLGRAPGLYVLEH